MELNAIHLITILFICLMVISFVVSFRLVMVKNYIMAIAAIVVCITTTLISFYRVSRDPILIPMGVVQPPPKIDYKKIGTIDGCDLFSFTYAGKTGYATICKESK